MQYEGVSMHQPARPVELLVQLSLALLHTCRCNFLENAGHPEALALQHRAEKVPALSPS